MIRYTKYKISTLLSLGFGVALAALILVAISAVATTYLARDGVQSFRQFSRETDLIGRLEINMFRVRMDFKNYSIYTDELYLDRYEKHLAELKESLREARYACKDSTRLQQISRIEQSVSEYDAAFEQIQVLVKEIEFLKADLLDVNGYRMTELLGSIYENAFAEMDPETVTITGKMLEHILQARLHAMKYLQSEDETDLNSVHQELETEFSRDIDDLRTSLGSVSQNKHLDEFLKVRALYLDTFRKIVKKHQVRTEIVINQLDRIGPVVTDGVEALYNSLNREEIALGDRNAKINTMLFWMTLIIATGGIFSTSYLAFRIRQNILSPLGAEIARMADMAERISRGDLNFDFQNGVSGRYHENDRSLFAVMKKMTLALKEQTIQIKSGTSDLSSTISQISSTATQLAASSAETNSAITEITSTVEEVRQTSEIASDKSKIMAERSDYLEQITVDGREATRSAVDGMNKIKAEMESVAESIVELSGKTQSISNILSTVNDLADQSNLLSVNASIEASKAGEYGKGFTVVAQEVKSLADQSKEATRQIKSILAEIQKATSTAVMATERVGKSVDEGVGLARQSGESIDTLSDNVLESTNISSQISASSQQQVEGMGQLVKAMENILQASKQNADGARQLQSACTNLDRLGNKMKEMANRFQIEN